MNVTSLIAKRYLNIASKHRLFAWVSILSILGVAMGVATMFAAMSIVTGFENTIRDRFLAANAHVLSFDYSEGIENPKPYEDYIWETFPYDLHTVSPFVHFESILKNEGTYAGALVRGIDLVKRKELKQLVRFIRPGSAVEKLTSELGKKFDPSGKRLSPIVLGASLAKKLKLEVGSEVSIIQSNSSGEFGNSYLFEVVGLYDSGFQYYDSKLGLIALNNGQHLLGYKKKVTGFELGLKNPGNAPKVAAQIYEDKKTQNTPWQSFNKDMFAMIAKDKQVIWMIVSLIALVAGFNILTTLFISVTLRQKDISILKTLGLSNRGILRVFIKQGLFIGVVGSILGVLIGWGFCEFIRISEIIQIPESSYYMKTLPVSYHYSYFLLLPLISISICLLSAFFPARQAARMPLMQGIRSI
jgi:lipoprotein-releasing system permease protein